MGVCAHTCTSTPPLTFVLFKILPRSGAVLKTKTMYGNMQPEKRPCKMNLNIVVFFLKANYTGLSWYIINTHTHTHADFYLKHQAT